MPNEPDRKYVRVYYNDLIRDYPDVWADNDRLATWLRLLATADPMWPTPPELPRSVKARTFGQLVDSSLVSTVAEGRYRMKGLDAEREMRSQYGRNAAAKRWHSEGIPPSDAPAMPKRVRAETSKDEQSSGAPASDDRWDAPEQPVLVWLSRHGCDVRPGNGYHQKLITAVEVHGSEKMLSVLDRLAAAGTVNGDIKGFLFRAIDALNSQTRPQLRAVEKDDAAEREQMSVKRRVENTKRHLHEVGHHQETPDPACPLCKERSA